MSESFKPWTDQARYDLDAARAMFDSGRYLYVLFCCQQAVEKLLKALIAERTKELPPRLHHLGRLAEVAALKTSDEQMGFLRELSAYYVETRYPEEVAGLAERVKVDEAHRVLAKTEEMAEWLSSML